MVRLSKNFTLQEFTKSQTALRHSIDNTPGDDHLANAKSLFECINLYIPDHRAGRVPTLIELQTVLDTLTTLMIKGPVFVHCLASVERSPLVCMAWLVKKYNLSPQQSLDYLMKVHPGTNPLPEQFSLLNSL